MIENKSRLNTEILYLEDKKEDLTSLTAVRRIHEVNNNKSSEKLIAAYHSRQRTLPRRRYTPLQRQYAAIVEGSML